MASTTHKGMSGATQHGSTQQKDQGGSSSESLTQQASSAAATAMETARDMASQAGKKASEAASYVGQKAEDATSSVGSSMKSLAGSIREHTPNMLGGAGSAVASTLESGGRYLEEQGLSGIGEDLTDLIRRNPIPSLLIGIGVGFLIARATRR
jgi:ElaB/YqjD/DUF883 family membrane-anchored ribosome-binding protein